MVRGGLLLCAGLAAAIMVAAIGIARADTALGSDAEKRVALVIGNSNYGGDLGVLPNPVNDARLMARTLAAIGFDVIEAEDADQNAMKRAISAFGAKLADAGPGSTGLFFYAGHGLQVAGTNYLIPVHARIEREPDVDIEAVPADLVLKQMDFAGSAVNIIILDACRNNPLSRGFRDMSRGLAEMTRKPLGSFISYSTAPGDVAADGSGADSPYTEALAAAIVKPGIGIEEAFREVRTRVMAETGGKQVPWDSSSMTAPFYFVPAAPAVGSAAPSSPSATPIMTNEGLFWDTIKDSSDPAMFEAYLQKFPQGDFVPLAEAKLAALNAKADTQVATRDASGTTTLVQPGTSLVQPATPPQTAMVQSPAAEAPLSETPPSDAPQPGRSFRDCGDCPEMVVVPAGTYVNGSPASEPGRDKDEAPQHRITLAQPFAVSRDEVTVAQYQAFLAATGRRADGACHPPAGQALDEPAVCISWNDAKDYAAWVAQQTGKPYRLLSETEWEYAARGGTTTAWPWGNDGDDGCAYANGKTACDDGARFTAPVGSLKPNGFDLYDMIGNAVEWVEDCYRPNYASAPADGGAVEGGNCARRVLRGGSWSSDARNLRAANRLSAAPDTRGLDFGIRLARDL